MMVLQRIYNNFSCRLSQKVMLVIHLRAFWWRITSLEFENDVVRIFKETPKGVDETKINCRNRKACFYLIRFSIRFLNHPLMVPLKPNLFVCFTLCQIFIYKFFVEMFAAVLLFFDFSFVRVLCLQINMSVTMLKLSDFSWII